MGIGRIARALIPALGKLGLWGVSGAAGQNPACWPAHTWRAGAYH